MLLEKKYGDGDVISLKLMSGEEVLGKLVKDDMLAFVLSKPVMLTAGAKGVGLAPYMLTVNPEREFSFNKAAVLSHGPTDQDIAKQYVEQTSGIALSAGTVV